MTDSPGNNFGIASFNNFKAYAPLYGEFVVNIVRTNKMSAILDTILHPIVLFVASTLFRPGCGFTRYLYCSVLCWLWYHVYKYELQQVHLFNSLVQINMNNVQAREQQLKLSMDSQNSPPVFNTEKALKLFVRDTAKQLGLNVISFELEAIKSSKRSKIKEKQEQEEEEKEEEEEEKQTEKTKNKKHVMF